MSKGKNLTIISAISNKNGYLGIILLKALVNLLTF